MEENELKEQEKKNKKLALILLIVLCSVSLIFGVVGGVTKFISFVAGTDEQTEENMMTPQEKEFSNGVFNILNGNNVIGSYKCEHSKCGYAFGVVDDNNYDLKTEELNEYQIRKVINNRYVLLYDDDEEDGTSHRSNGVKVYDFTTSQVVKEYKAVKNYNRNDMVVFMAQDNSEKWGVIKFDADSVVDMVKPEYDYIGAFVPSGELLTAQGFYAAKKNDDWYILDINKGTEYSREFTEPIAAYDGEMVVTKVSGGFNVYDVKGNLLFDKATDYNFPGGGLLVVSNQGKVTVFDAYAITTLFTSDYVQISNLTAMETETGFEVKVNDEVVYTKADKKKSERNINGADYSMIIS